MKDLMVSVETKASNVALFLRVRDMLGVEAQPGGIFTLRAVFSERFLIIIVTTFGQVVILECWIAHFLLWPLQIYSSSEIGLTITSYLAVNAYLVFFIAINPLRFEEEHTGSQAVALVSKHVDHICFVIRLFFVDESGLLRLSHAIDKVLAAEWYPLTHIVFVHQPAGVPRGLTLTAPTTDLNARQGFVARL